jgi:uncharacterized RDD family membrane protein YckC
MTVLRLLSLASAVVGLAAVPAGAQVSAPPAQAPAPTQSAPATAPAERPVRVIPPSRPNRILTVGEQIRFEPAYIRRRPVLRIGQDYTVQAGDVVRQVVAVSGTVTVDGRVDEDVFVTLGDVRLSSTAVVAGSLIVTGGNVTVAQGADVQGDLVVIGGAVDAPAGFSSRGQHVLVGTPPFGDWLRQVVPWFTRGLIVGRLIVPDMGWVWGVVAVFFFIAFVFNLVFDRQVRACADVVAARPFGTMTAGLLMMVLLVPMFLILAATVVGLIVIPFLACAVAVAWMVGKVGIVRGIGAGIVHPSDPESRAQGVRSLVLGFAVMCVAYMVPVLGLITWALIGSFGLGAATLTTMAALRRESPKRSKVPPPVPPATATEPPPPDVPPMPPPAPVYQPSSVMSAVGVPEPSGLGGTYGAEMPAPASLDAAAEPGRSAAPEGTGAPPASATIAAGAAVSARAAYATFLDRTAAFVLDCVLVAIMYQMLRFSRNDDTYFLVLFVYHIAFWAWMGTTMGGIIVGIKVVRTDTGSVRFVDALVRGFASLFSLAALGIGCLWMLQDADRQMWHDKVAGTYVVKVPRNLLLA